MCYQVFVTYGSQHTQLFSHITSERSMSNIDPFVELGPVLCWLLVDGLTLLSFRCIIIHIRHGLISIADC